MSSTASSNKSRVEDGSLQGSVKVISLPANFPSHEHPLGIAIHLGQDDPYVSVVLVADDSAMIGKIEAGDLLMSLGEHNLLNCSIEQCKTLLTETSMNARSLVLLRPAASTTTDPDDTIESATTATNRKRRSVLARGVSSPTKKQKSNPRSRSTPETQTKGGNENEPIELMDSDLEVEPPAQFKNENGEEVGQTPKQIVPADTDVATRTVYSRDQDMPEPTCFPPADGLPFPYTIDTGFGGSCYKKKPIFLKNIPLVRSSNQESELPLIWPATTPVPDATGGFYELLDSVNAGSAVDTRKGNLRSRKTLSRVARLAGKLTVRVEIKGDDAARLLVQPSVSIYISSSILWETIHQYPNQAIVSEETKLLLRAITNLNDRSNPFRDRCLYVLASTPVHPLSIDDRNSYVGQFTFRVYFRRALFGLSTNPNIQILLESLEPIDDNQDPWVPCRKIQKSSHHYQHSERPGATTGGRGARNFDHSLPGILWANESLGYSMNSPRTKRYKGLSVSLRDYQQESVAWMTQQENLNVEETGGGVAGLNGYFWEKRTLADGDVYYYFPLGGEILLTPPPTVSGGLLCEEMGLGKTIITMELICTDAGKVSKEDCGTLIVLPVSLLKQWEEELKTKAPHLKFYSYHGSNVNSFHTKHHGKLAEGLAKYDVVLTTMSKLKELTASRNRGHARVQLKHCLDKVKWNRLVVDECQFLKNDTTAIARAASGINARHVWMLSGTPLTSRLDDLRGELSLLRIWPFTLGTTSDEDWCDHFWTEYIRNSWDSRDGASLPIVRKLMNAVCIRHSRMQLRGDGTPLVTLPTRIESFVAITMDSSSSHTYVSRFVESVAAKLLRSFGRFDLRVCALILRLQQLASSPSGILDQSTLEHIDNSISAMTLQATTTDADNPGEIRKISLKAAIIERRGDKDSIALQELVLVAEHGPDSLSHCIFCIKRRQQPAYLKCGHSLCITCCELALECSGSFPCPVCDTPNGAKDIIEVLLPETLPDASELNSMGSTRRRHRAINVDLDNREIDTILAAGDHRFSEKSPQIVETRTTVGSARETACVTDPKTSYKSEKLTGEVDFQQQSQAVSISNTLEALSTFQTPGRDSSTAGREFRSLQNLENGFQMKSLFRHALVCKNNLIQTPKIRALCDSVQSIRDSSLEAKICIFSTFGGVLDDVERALSTIQYTVELDMNWKTILIPGQRVVHISSEARGHIVKRLVSIEDVESGFDYDFETDDGDKYPVRREDIKVPPVTVGNVPPSRIRTDTNDKKLSTNGSEDRHGVGSLIECKRPVVDATKLQVGYAVTILPCEEDGVLETGKVIFVHLGNGDTPVSYNIQPEGFKQDCGEQTRKDVLYNIPPARLEDKGGNHWVSGIVKAIYGKRKLSDAEYVSNDGDPFERAIGYVRLDGSTGSALRRGEILDTFKRDPMASICLLTKTSAGVGLNLTDANHVLILEPSMDAHDEMQSIARVHRIGQTRKVSVLKFFIRDSIEERILKRRQQRGELSVTINSSCASNGSDQDVTTRTTNGKSDKDMKIEESAEVSSSRTMTYQDMKFLLGVP